jgi:hypothetical protein
MELTVTNRSKAYPKGARTSSAERIMESLLSDGFFKQMVLERNRYEIDECEARVYEYP